MADRESRKKQITARRQEQILAAAHDVFKKKGYSAATIPEIARSAGVAAGTIYLYYPGKRDLFIAMMQKMSHTVAVQNIIGQIATVGFPSAFKMTLMSKLETARKADIASIISLWGDIERETELREALIQQLIKPAMSQLETFYRERMAAGEFRRVDPAIALRMVQAVILGLTIFDSLEGENGPLHNIPPDELAERILDILLNGLAGRPPDGQTKPDNRVDETGNQLSKDPSFTNSPPPKETR